MTEKVTMTTEEIIQLATNGVLPVRIDPEKVMTDWTIYEVRFDNDSYSYHAVGWCDGSYRVCSPIRKFNPVERSFVTRSGREYFIPGDRYEVTIEDDIGGEKGKAMNHAFAFWCKKNGAVEIEETNQLFVDAMNDARDSAFMIDIRPDGELVRNPT